MKPLGAQHRRHRLGRDRIVDGNAGQLRESLRTVARLRDGGAPKPSTPTTHTVRPAHAGMTGSCSACAFSGSLFAPSASTST